MGTSRSRGFGSRVAAVGDVDGDGYGDLAVAAPNATFAGRSSAGYVNVYRGSETGILAAYSVQLTGDAGASFGSLLVGVGDSNKDGHAEVGVGFMLPRSGLTLPRPALMVLPGASSGLDRMRAIVLSGGTTPGEFNLVAASIGDCNGDGFSDVAAVFPTGDTTGAVQLFHGSATGLASPTSMVFVGERSGDSFGRSIEPIGDINSDGLADFAIVASGADPGGRTDVGETTVHLGDTAGLRRASALSLAGGTTTFARAPSLYRAGDINGDGFADMFAVGRDASSGTTRAHLLLGAANVSSITAAPTSTNAEALDRFDGVVRWGDFDGDGFADVAVGAREAEGGIAPYTGVTTVAFGSTSGLGVWRSMVGLRDSSFGAALATRETKPLSHPARCTGNAR
jgi:hypothetical protein